MKRLVVNADDLGLDARIDEGIFRAHAEGIVTSASLLVTGQTAGEAAARAKDCALALGVHLCLTTHLTPAAPARSVRWLAPGGRFRRNWAEFALAWASRLIPGEEVSQELRAQVDRARALGVDVDHLDMHQHLHLLPGITPRVEALAAELGLPLRWPAEPARLGWAGAPRAAAKAALLKGLARAAQAPRAVRIPAWGLFESGALSERRLLNLLARMPDGAELVCHPGLSPALVREDPQWRYGWETELAALVSPAVREAVVAHGITLSTYRQLG